MKKDYLVLVGLAVALLAAIGLCSACTDRVIPAPAPTEVPTVAAPEPAATDASPPPTDTPSPTAEPTTEPTARILPSMASSSSRRGSPSGRAQIRIAGIDCAM